MTAEALFTKGASTGWSGPEKWAMVGPDWQATTGSEVLMVEGSDPDGRATTESVVLMGGPAGSLILNRKPKQGV